MWIFRYTNDRTGHYEQLYGYRKWGKHDTAPALTDEVKALRANYPTPRDE